ncbi:hypothetical protein [Alteromonas sp. P256]
MIILQKKIKDLMGFQFITHVFCALKGRNEKEGIRQIAVLLSVLTLSL